MNWDMMGALAELTGAIAVVFSLLYVARQVRDGAEEAQRRQYFDLNKEAVAFADAISHDDEWGKLAFRGFTDRSALEPYEILRFNSGMLGLFRAWEALFHYSQEGGVPDWGADGFRAMLADVLGFPGVQDYWRDRAHWYSSEFQKEVAGMIERARPLLLEGYDELATS